MATPIKLHTVLANTGNNFDNTEKAQARANIDAADAADVAQANTEVVSASASISVRMERDPSDNHRIYTLDAADPVWAHYANGGGGGIPWDAPAWPAGTEFDVNPGSKDAGSGISSLQSVPAHLYWFDIEDAVLILNSTPNYLTFEFKLYAQPTGSSTWTELYSNTFNADGSIVSSGFDSVQTFWFGGAIQLYSDTWNTSQNPCALKGTIALLDQSLPSGTARFKWSHLYIHEIH